MRRSREAGEAPPAYLERRRFRRIASATSEDPGSARTAATWVDGPELSCPNSTRPLRISSQRDQPAVQDALRWHIVQMLGTRTYDSTDDVRPKRPSPPSARARRTRRRALVRGFATKRSLRLNVVMRIVALSPSKSRFKPLYCLASSLHRVSRRGSDPMPAWTRSNRLAGGPRRGGRCLGAFLDGGGAWTAAAHCDLRPARTAAAHRRGAHGAARADCAPVRPGVLDPAMRPTLSRCWTAPATAA